MPRTPREGQRRRVAGKCGGRCWYCGKVPDRELTVDHAKPRSRGGGNWDGNLLPACRDCNNLKGDNTVSEFRKHVRARVVRRLTPLGFLCRASRVRIVFFGEGNSSPFAW